MSGFGILGHISLVECDPTAGQTPLSTCDETLNNRFEVAEE